MTRNSWRNLGPGILVGAGIIMATLLASLAANSGWLVMSGPLLLAIAAIGANMLDSWSRGRVSGPSAAALIVASTILLTGLIVALRDPGEVQQLIPVIGAGCWVVLLRPENRSKTCGGV
jgi:hypothetical protein